MQCLRNNDSHASSLVSEMQSMQRTSVIARKTGSGHVVHTGFWLNETLVNAGSLIWNFFKWFEQYLKKVRRRLKKC